MKIVKKKKCDEDSKCDEAGDSKKGYIKFTYNKRMEDRESKGFLIRFDAKNSILHAQHC